MEVSNATLQQSTFNFYDACQKVCCLPAVKKSDTSLLHQLINHVSSHMNALKALSFNVPSQDNVESPFIICFGC